MVESLIEWANWMSRPEILTTISIIIFILSLKYYRTWTKPPVFAVICVLLVGLFGVSMLNDWFYVQVTEAKHVPTIGFLALTVFFGWLSLRQAAVNDAYIEQNREIPEKAEAEKDVLTWPDLVFTEFLSTLFVTVVLMVWALTLNAPLEEPAAATFSPNPAKAPWYFLGLQELLVFFDPWIAGVLIPTFIIIGLMAVPYMDRNPRGNGYYTFIQRPFAISTFLFMWYILWVGPIVQGTFLRGPNWAFFGVFEPWDTAKTASARNIVLSDIIWVDILGTLPPQTGLEIPLFLLNLPVDPFIREIFGFLFLAAYFIIPPLVLARTWMKDLYLKLGILRYGILCFLGLSMIGLPIKMYLRWVFEFKYFVEIQQLYLNI